MIIALSIWNGRIAPVFDVAMQLLIVDVQERKIVKQKQKRLPSNEILEKAIMLQQLDINLLICGAVSEQVKLCLDMYEINVISFISGDIHKILNSWLSDSFNEADFAMPGCGKQKECGNSKLLYCRRKRKPNKI